MSDIPKADIRLERYDQTTTQRNGWPHRDNSSRRLNNCLENTTDRVSQSHFQFQITTFWIGLVYFFVGFLTLHIAVDFLIIDRHQMREGSSCLEHG